MPSVPLWLSSWGRRGIGGATHERKICHETEPERHEPRIGIQAVEEIRVRHAATRSDDCPRKSRNDREHRGARKAERVEILAETELDTVCATLEAERPDVCVIDSIQTL